VAGFLKESSSWLRAWWLSSIPDDDAGKPPLSGASPHTVFIVEAWRTGDRADGTPVGPNRTVHVYTDAPMVRLEVNGKEVVPPTANLKYMNPNFTVAYEPGNLTAVALSLRGEVLGTHSKLTAGRAVSIRLSLDAPSVLTGTGSSLVADGEDTAMVGWSPRALLSLRV